MPIARLAALAAALVTMLALPATSSAAQMTFGSDLAPNPSFGGASGTYTWATVAPRTGSGVPAAAPQSGVVVQMSIKTTGSGTIKFRLLNGTSPAFTSRVARPDGNAATGH